MFFLPLLCPVMLALMLVLLWVGMVCLCYRQLHQTSTLSVAVMEESYQDTLECTEEDITDKVRGSALLERVVFAMPRDPQAGAGLKPLLLCSWCRVNPRRWDVQNPPDGAGGE